MIRISAVLIAAFVASINSHQTEIEGTYQGSNLIINNPYTETNGYCIEGIILNDKSIQVENDQDLVIDLSGCYIGQYVNLKINHPDICRPKPINPDALRSNSTFKLVDMEVNETMVKFVTEFESTEEPFYVEQNRNSKWVIIGKLKGKGTPTRNEYTLNVEHVSNINRYRIKQRNLGGRFVYCLPVSYTSNKVTVDLYPKRVTDMLYFTQDVLFEIFDGSGNLVKKEKSREVDLSHLAAGIYYVNLDNRTEKIIKK
ncbi:MAG: T9SS type A sorting domain-containing protein [Bacteroidetes bacterium]|nr:T9SS type A sorting domain-containing protein [Bacteroidota bacterium]